MPRYNRTRSIRATPAFDRDEFLERAMRRCRRRTLERFEGTDRWPPARIGGGVIPTATRRPPQASSRVPTAQGLNSGLGFRPPRRHVMSPQNLLVTALYPCRLLLAVSNRLFAISATHDQHRLLSADMCIL